MLSRSRKARLAHGNLGSTFSIPSRARLAASDIGGVIGCRTPLLFSPSLAYTASYNTRAFGYRAATMSTILAYAPRRYPHASPGSNHSKISDVVRLAPSTCSSQSASVSVMKSCQKSRRRVFTSASSDMSDNSPSLASTSKRPSSGRASQLFVRSSRSLSTESRSTTQNVHTSRSAYAPTSARTSSRRSYGRQNPWNPSVP
mmetsp:Transcript_4506/g.15988  ORF Transcript_4506/g.15988 Transcript_4506/m.15988 type:complete len:201 (-) Transcript_4506:484-1086(-)|eukprot:30566-Pelagococcus_subviridis.AAC.7